jgi:tetratricopeptide (TPR) repeat protein
MGDCFRGQLKMDKAVYWWEKILDQEPENQALWTRVADALVTLGRLDEAVTHYNASLQVSYDLYAVLGMARVSQKQGDLDKARYYCEQVLEEDGDNVRALEELAHICDDAGFTEKAQQLRDRISD